MTKQRRAIYAAIQASPRHMTAEEICDAARTALPGVSRATVYRNLSLMERDGQVRRVKMADAPDRFDRTLSPHEHVFCPQCGALEDLALPWLTGEIEQALGRTVAGVSLNVNALCSVCAGQMNEEMQEE